MSLLDSVKRKSSSVSWASGANLPSPAAETTASTRPTSRYIRWIDRGQVRSTLMSLLPLLARSTSCLGVSARTMA